MYSHDQIVQGVKSRVLLYNLLEQGQYNKPRQLVLTSETDSYWLYSLIYMFLYR